MSAAAIERSRSRRSVSGPLRASISRSRAPASAAGNPVSSAAVTDRALAPAGRYRDAEPSVPPQRFEHQIPDPVPGVGRLLPNPLIGRRHRPEGRAHHLTVAVGQVDDPVDEHHP